MSNLSKLTDEELVALDKGDYSKLSDESLKALAAEDDSPKYAPGQTHVIDPETKRAMPVPEEDVTPDITATDALMRGVQEGVPFAKHASAAASALLDDGAVFSESYSRNINEINDAINEAEEKHPVAFNAGDFGVGFALPAAKSYKAAMAMGALSGVSRTEEVNPWDIGFGASIGAASGALGLKIGTVAGEKIAAVGKKLGLLSDDTTKEILVRNKDVEEINSHIRKWYVGSGEDLTDGTAKFADDLLNVEVGGQKLITGNDIPETIFQKSRDLVETTGKAIDDAIEQVDYKLTSSNVHNIFTSIRRNLGIDDMMQGSQETQKLGATYLDKLTKEFFDETGEFVERKTAEGTVELIPRLKAKDLTLRDLVTLKRDFANLSNTKHLNGQAAAANNLTGFWGSLTKEMSKIVPELAEQTGKIDKATLKTLNKNFANAKLVERTTKSLANKEKNGMLGKLRNLLQYKSMVLTASMLAGTAGMATVGPSGAVVAGAAALLTGIAADPRAPQKFAIGLRKLSGNLQNPNYAKHIQRLSVTAGVSIEAFRDKLSSIGSQLYLESEPLDRNNDSARENAPELLNILQDEIPEMAPVFRKALENNDDNTISMVMEQLSELESASKFVKSGRGWNGVTFNPETKMMLDKEIEKMDISRLQKSKLKQGLKLNSDEPGVIPQVEAEPDRFLQFKTRDKKRPQY